MKPLAQVPKPLERLVDLEAEAAFVGALLLDSRALHMVAPSDFYAAAHATVLEAAQRVEARGENVESVTVRIELDRMGKLAAIGGDEFLMALTDSVPSVARQPEIAFRLRELEQARAAREAHVRAVAAYERGDLERARRLEREISDEHGEPARVKVRPLAEAAYELVQRWDAGETNLCPFGIPPLDELVGGLERSGSLFVFGAYQHTGKSYLALTIALAQAKLGERPGIVSVEDSDRLWAARALAVTTRIPAGRLRRGEVSDREKGRAIEGAEALRRLGVEFADPIAGDTDDVVTAMIELVRDRGCTVLEVDYLQAIEGEGRDPRERTNRTLGALKRTAKRLGVPLILFSQVRRLEEGKSPEPPTSALKESGDIENRAEGIGMGWRFGPQPEDGGFDTRPLMVRLTKVKGEPVAGSLVRLERHHSGLWWDIDDVRVAPVQRDLFVEGAAE